MLPDGTETNAPPSPWSTVPRISDRPHVVRARTPNRVERDGRDTGNAIGQKSTVEQSTTGVHASSFAQASSAASTTPPSCPGSVVPSLGSPGGAEPASLVAHASTEAQGRPKPRTARFIASSSRCNPSSSIDRRCTAVPPRDRHHVAASAVARIWLKSASHPSSSRPLQSAAPGTHSVLQRPCRIPPARWSRDTDMRSRRLRSSPGRCRYRHADPPGHPIPRRASAPACTRSRSHRLGGSTSVPEHTGLRSRRNSTCPSAGRSREPSGSIEPLQFPQNSRSCTMQRGALHCPSRHERYICGKSGPASAGGGPSRRRRHTLRSSRRRTRNRRTRRHTRWCLEGSHTGRSSNRRQRDIGLRTPAVRLVRGSVRFATVVGNAVAVDEARVADRAALRADAGHVDVVPARRLATLDVAAAAVQDVVAQNPSRTRSREACRCAWRTSQAVPDTRWQCRGRATRPRRNQPRERADSSNPSNSVKPGLSLVSPAPSVNGSRAHASSVPTMAAAAKTDPTTPRLRTETIG